MQVLIISTKKYNNNLRIRFDANQYKILKYA